MAKEIPRFNQWQALQTRQATSYYPDLSKHTMIVSEPLVRAIGWLDSEHDYPIGIAPEKFIHKLRQIRECETLVGLYASELVRTLSKYAGFHTCELCNDYQDIDAIAVPGKHVVYIAPKMIVHYVETHGYLPPREFINAVLASPAAGTIDYMDAVAEFRGMHQRWLKHQVHKILVETLRFVYRRVSPILDRVLSNRKQKKLYENRPSRRRISK